MSSMLTNAPEKAARMRANESSGSLERQRSCRWQATPRILRGETHQAEPIVWLDDFRVNVR